MKILVRGIAVLTNNFNTFSWRVADEQICDT
jgi:hypothetical protein